MSHATIQTYREMGLVYLDGYGCNTNFHSVAHARDSPIPIVSRVIFPSYLFYITFLTYNFLSKHSVSSSHVLLSTSFRKASGCIFAHNRHKREATVILSTKMHRYLENSEENSLYLLDTCS